MNYEECRDWLENRRLTIGSVPGLDAVNELLGLLGRPDEQLTFIHIAGTNGKGTTGYLIESVLVNNNIRTGRFLSPAVIDEREIILVNGKMVYKTIWAEKLSEIIEVVEANNLKATAFEIEFVLSLLIFIDKKCQLVILECGMGGRLDATNAINKSLVDVITSLSVDHRNFLGDTLEEISLHKFGIISSLSKNVVLAHQIKEVYEYFDIYIKNPEFKGINIVKAEKDKLNSTFVKVDERVVQILNYKNYVNLQLSLAGIYQTENAITALEVVDVLINEGYKLKEDKIRKAFLQAVWPGRFEILKTNHLYILDGAHNMDAVERLFENMSLYFTNRRLIYIMGMYKDKDYRDVVKFVAPKGKAIVTVSARDRKRCVEAFELGKTFSEYNPNVTAADSYTEALEIANLLADKNDIILIFGSLSFLGEMRELILKK